MDAFTSRWVTRFGTVYEDKPLREISWFTGTAGPELAKLIIDGTIPRGSRIIDLGCGAGIDAIFLAQQGMIVTGVDISPVALQIGEQLASIYGVKLNFIHADILDVPLPDGEADLVNDSYVFHNVRPESRARYASQVYRLLRPGGLFVVRGFSDWMTPGTGPIRLRARDILDTFLADFDCEHLSRFRGLPTEKRPDQWHWMAIWRRKQGAA
jgi:SAM-dependent methyltransferase